MTDFGVYFLLRHSNWRRLKLTIHSLLIVVLLDEVLFSLALLLRVLKLIVVVDGCLLRSLFSWVVLNLVYHRVCSGLNEISKFLGHIYGGELHSSQVIGFVVVETMIFTLFIIFHTFCY